MFSLAAMLFNQWTTQSEGADYRPNSGVERGYQVNIESFQARKELR
jgi:hypothetical protein